MRHRRAVAATEAHGWARQPVDGLTGLIHEFFLFFKSINRGGQQTASEKFTFYVTFAPRCFFCPPRKMLSVRLGSVFPVVVRGGRAQAPPLLGSPGIGLRASDPIWVDLCLMQ
jgi:hypothetical protein